MSVSEKYFLDTNIFVYSFDRKNKQKFTKAKNLIKQALEDKSTIISTQVIQEFLNVATRKFTPALTGYECRSYLELVLKPLCDVFMSFELYAKALILHEQYKISFYDALIVASALIGDCRVLLSEDFQDGMKFDSLVVRNPF